MLFLNHDLSKEEQDQASARLYQEWEEYREKIFDRFVSSGYWNNEERAVVKDTILSPTVDSLTSQLLVSAITLSAATVFDMGKFTLLYDIYRLADDDEVKVRASWDGCWFLRIAAATNSSLTSVALQSS